MLFVYVQMLFVYVQICLSMFISVCVCSYLFVYVQIWLQLFGVWCTFCVSLILFPAIQSNIKMVREEVQTDNGTMYTTQLFSEEFGTHTHTV